MVLSPPPSSSSLLLRTAQRRWRRPSAAATAAAAAAAAPDAATPAFWGAGCRRAASWAAGPSPLMLPWRTWHGGAASTPQRPPLRAATGAALPQSQGQLPPLRVLPATAAADGGRLPSAARVPQHCMARLQNVSEEAAWLIWFCGRPASRQGQHAHAVAVAHPVPSLRARSHTNDAHAQQAARPSWPLRPWPALQAHACTAPRRPGLTCCAQSACSAACG